MSEVVDQLPVFKRKPGRPSFKELQQRKGVEPEVGKLIVRGKGFGTNSKWDQDTCTKSYEYINGGYDELGDALPSVEGLANCLGVSRNTLYKWKDTKPAFREVMEAMETGHTRVTMNKACNGDIPSNLGMMLLSRQGYSAGGGSNAGGMGGVQIVVNFGHPDQQRQPKEITGQIIDGN